MKKILTIWFLATTSVFNLAMGQQNASFSMYMFNGQLINPAYVGSKDQLTMASVYRHQWAGVEGAPRTFSYGVHSPLKKDQYALGLTLTHDRLGVSKLNSLYLQYAYRLKLGDRYRLAFGMQAGFSHYSPRYEDLILTDAPKGTDQVFANSQNLMLPNFGFGIYFTAPHFYIGISVPHLLENSLSKKLEIVTNSTDMAHQFRYYLFTAGYVFGKSHAKIKYKPSVLLKYVPGTPFDFDGNFSILIVDRYWIGVSYRLGGNRSSASEVGLGESIIGMFEMKITQQLSVGYSYDQTLSSLNQGNMGTHEFFLGYEFSFIKNKFIDPRYIKHF